MLDPPIGPLMGGGEVTIYLNNQNKCPVKRTKSREKYFELWCHS